MLQNKKQKQQGYGDELSSIASFGLAMALDGMDEDTVRSIEDAYAELQKVINKDKSEK
jgi:hypothetical protein